MGLPAPFRGWFQVRRELSQRRQAGLSIISFLMPVVVWCIVSYVPWIWHPDMKLQISADRDGVTTVFTAGDHLSKDYYPTFVESVRDENAAVVKAIAAGTPIEGSKRANQKLLRHIGPVAVEEGWLDYDDGQNDELIYGVWRDLATGARTSSILDDENLEVIRSNWGVLGAQSQEFDYKALPTEKLLKLIPQAVPANPVYLPAPDEVLRTGWRDFTAEPENEGASMGDRYRSSLKVIFKGFFWACLIGLPIGILCGTYDFFARLFEPFTDFFRYMPAPTFSTLLVAILAADGAPKVALVFIGTVPHMILMISKTTRLLDPSLLEAAQTLGAKSGQLLSRVVVPGILPNLYNDLRILLGWAWTWLVIAELIGVKSGLTEFIETQGRYRNFDRVFPVIILIGLTGFITDQILAWLHGVLFPFLGTSGKISRAVARVLFWPFRTVSQAARERVESDERAAEERRIKSAAEVS